MTSPPRTRIEATHQVADDIAASPVEQQQGRGVFNAGRETFRNSRPGGLCALTIWAKTLNSNHVQFGALYDFWRVLHWILSYLYDSCGGSEERFG